LRHADVYVFALLASRDKSTVNPLNLDQWMFYCTTTSDLSRELPKDRKTIPIKVVERIAGKPVTFSELKGKVLSLMHRS